MRRKESEGEGKRRNEREREGMRGKESEREEMRGKASDPGVILFSSISVYRNDSISFP